MKTVKKALTALTLGTFFVFLTGCSCADRSWAVKSDGESITTGVYVYYLMDKYQAALNKLAEKGISTTDVRQETIEDKSALSWIVDKTLETCKEKLAIEKRFKDMGLELTEEELKKAEETTEQIWNSAGSMYEKNFGINKETFHQAYSLLNAKREKIFMALYGKDGSSAVSDEEITTYYKENYIALKFYSKMPTTEAETSESGEENAENKEEKKIETAEDIEKQLREYVDAINNGSKTIDQIRDLIKTNDKVEGEHDPLVEQVINMTSTTFPQEIIDAVKDLDTGKATHIKFNELYLFLYKSAAGESLTVPDLNNEIERKKILYEMKADEFDEKIHSVINGMNIQINYNAVNQYDPIILGQSVIQG